MVLIIFKIWESEPMSNQGLVSLNPKALTDHHWSYMLIFTEMLDKKKYS